MQHRLAHARLSSNACHRAVVVEQKFVLGSRHRDRMIIIAASNGVQVDVAASVQLKERLFGMVGPSNGVDRTPEQHQQIKDILLQLETCNPTPSPAQYPLKGTQWQLVYSTSTGNSAGKLGPFIGKTGQRFSADQQDSFMNYSVFLSGLLAAELDGQYTPRNDTRIDLLFLSTRFLLLWGLLKVQRQMPAGVKAHWTMKYIDDELRVLTTNKGSYFVLKRVAADA